MWLKGCLLPYLLVASTLFVGWPASSGWPKKLAHSCLSLIERKLAPYSLNDFLAQFPEHTKYVDQLSGFEFWHGPVEGKPISQKVYGDHWESVERTDDYTVILIKTFRSQDGYLPGEGLQAIIRLHNPDRSLASVLKPYLTLEELVSLQIGNQVDGKVRILPNEQSGPRSYSLFPNFIENVGLVQEGEAGVFAFIVSDLRNLTSKPQSKQESTDKFFEIIGGLVSTQKN